jgi:hypothetical protein
MLSAELNYAQLDGEPDESIGLAFAPDAVAALDEITEGQWLF